MSDPFPLPSHQQGIVDFLAMRRSNLAKTMGGPGPDAAQLEQILEIGVRVPDHRKLAPWRLEVFQGDRRAEFGRLLKSVYRDANPNHPDDRADFEANRFLRAPVVIGVLSTPKDCLRGTPIWEQQLSSGAVCFNLCLAAQAMGFGAQWLTEWYAYDPKVHESLHLAAGDQIAGFVYIGTPTQPSLPRTRPNLSDVVSFS